MSSLRLLIEEGQFRDQFGRELILRGINVAADAKYPSEPDQPSHIATAFFDGDNVKFHDRPFPRDEAHVHFSRLKGMGYNLIRYIFNWESIEAAGPGKYDDEYCQQTIDVLRIAKQYGFYIFMDPHQDVVSDADLEWRLERQTILTRYIVVTVLWRIWSPHVDSVCMRA